MSAASGALFEVLPSCLAWVGASSDAAVLRDVSIAGGAAVPEYPRERQPLQHPAAWPVQCGQDEQWLSIPPSAALLALPGVKG